MPKKLDITGHVFGRLTALSEEPKQGPISLWRCTCSCGNEHVAALPDLRRGRVQSCGCRKLDLLIDRTKTHGMTKTRTYRIWAGMIQRCNNPNVFGYPWYGARGIRVCDRWLQFQNFLSDMGHAPAGLSIDRYPDNDGNYEPGNCRWATRSQQRANQRTRHG